MSDNDRLIVRKKEEKEEKYEKKLFVVAQRLWLTYKSRWY